MGAGSWTYGRLCSSEKSVCHKRLRRVGGSRKTARRACELAALGLVADRLQQSRRAMAQRTEAGWPPPHEPSAHLAGSLKEFVMTADPGGSRITELSWRRAVLVCG